MVITKHISLDDECIKRLEPYIEKHYGNLSAALKEIILHAGTPELPHNSLIIDSPAFKWMLLEIEGSLVPDGILDEIIDPMLINSMGKLEEYLRRRISELKWEVNLFLRYDNDRYPGSVSIELNGNPQKIKFVALVLSQYLVKNSLEKAPLKINNVIRSDESIKVELIKSDKEVAQNSLIAFFGPAEEIRNIIKSRPAFWKAVTARHHFSNYNMVTVHRNYFEDLLANKIPLGEIMIENLAKKPLQEIPLKEMLNLIKDVYETSRIAERVDIDNDNFILFHTYRTNEAIEKLKKILVMLLEANGHLYDAKSTANMIVLTHRPDVGTKINEIVDNLKTSNSRLDQELILFLSFLGELKDMEDIPLSLTALGRRIGKSLMQEFENENDIKSWNLEIFKNAFETINNRLQIESELKLDGKNLLYTIKKCNIAQEGNELDPYICRTIRETFKGALNYAFGKNAELEIKKLLTHGDNFCEVIIRIP